MLTATTFLVLVTVILQGVFMQPVMQCLGFGSAAGEKGSSSKDENGSPNRNNNNNNSYKDKGGGGDDEDNDDIPNVESLHPSSGKKTKRSNRATDLLPTTPGKV